MDKRKLCEEAESLREEVASLRDRKKCLIEQIEHLRCYLILEDRQITEQNEMSSKMALQYRKENADLRLKIKELKDETMCLKTVADSMYDKLTTSKSREIEDDC